MEYAQNSELLPEKYVTIIFFEKEVMSAIHFESTYDDSKLQAGIKRSNQTVGQWAQNAEKNGEIVSKTWNNMTRAATAYLSYRFAQQIGNDIIQTRGEFQQLNIAFETMLGSKAKADQMMSDVINRALVSPFTVRDIATQTKQLIAMGVSVEDVSDTVKTLGDIAAGTSMPLSRLAINYGQVVALGKLRTREINDFAMNGVPLVEELADMYGKAREEIYAMVEASEIGSKDVEKAFARMTGEGGKFYNLMEKQNASITGQISNLRDKLDLMFNDIGKSNEGFIYGSIESLGNLVAHYEDVLKILKVLVVTYGSYKAATIAISAYEAVIAKTEATRVAIIERKVAAIQKEIIAQEARAASEAKAASAMEIAASIELTNQKLIQNASAKTLAAKEALATATSELASAEAAYLVVAQKYPYSMNTAKEAIAAKTAVEKAKTNVSKANAAVEAAISKETVVNANIEAKAVQKSEAEKIAAKKAGIKADQERLIASQTATTAEVRAAQKASIFSKLFAGSNWIITAVVGITALASAFSALRRRSEEAYVAGTNYNKNLTEQKERLDQLFSRINKAEKGTNDHAKAIDDANKFLKEYNVSLKDEKGNLVDLETAYKDAVSAIDAFVAKQAKANELMEAGKLLTSDPLSALQKSQQGFGALGIKLSSDDIRILQDFVKNNVSLINESITYSTFEGVTKYVKDGRLTEFQKVLSESISGAGSETLSNIFQFDTSSLYDFLSKSADQLTAYRDRVKEINDYYDPLLESQKLSLTEDEKKLSTSELIKRTQADIVAAETELKRLRAKDYVSPKNDIVGDIESQEEVVKGLKTKLETLTGIKKKETEKQLKTEEERLNAVQELADQELSIWQNLEQSKVDAMKAGAERQRQQAKLNYDWELADIEKQGRDYLEKFNDSKGLKLTDKGYITELPADVQENLNAQKKNAETKYNADIVQINENAALEIKKFWDETTEAFLDNVEREKRDINNRYDEQVRQAKLAGATVIQIAIINAARLKELQNVQQDAAAKLSPLYERAFGEIEKYSVRALQKIREQLKAVLDSAKQLNVDGKTMIEVMMPTGEFDEQGKAVTKTLRMTIDEFTQWKRQLNDISGEVQDKNPFVALKNAFKDYREARAKYKQALDTGDKAAVDAAKANMDQAANATVAAALAVAEKIKEIIQDIGELGEAIGGDFGDALSSASETISAAMDIASGDYIKGLTKFINMFKGREAKKEIEELQKASSKIEDVQNAINKLLERRIELIKLSTAAEAGFLDTLNQETAEKFKQYYENIFEGLYNNELFGLAGKNNDLSLEAIMERFGLSSLEEFVNWWNDAGYTDMLLDGYNITNEEYWQSIIDGWNSVTEAAEQSTEAMQEAITGVSFDDLTNEMDGLIMNAETTGEDVADSLTGNIQKGIMQWVQTSYLNEEMQKWYEELYSSLDDSTVNNFGLTDAERNSLQALYNQIYSKGKDLYNTALDIAGIDTSGQGSYNELKGIQASLTEETGSIIAGVGTAIRIDVKGIEENTRQGTDYLMQSIAIQQQIADNTSHNSNLGPIYEELQRINDTLEKGLL